MRAEQFVNKHRRFSTIQRDNCQFGGIQPFHSAASRGCQLETSDADAGKNAALFEMVWKIRYS
jgi:hypothetical protein